MPGGTIRAGCASEPQSPVGHRGTYANCGPSPPRQEESEGPGSSWHLLQAERAERAGPAGPHSHCLQGCSIQVVTFDRGGRVRARRAGALPGEPESPLPGTGAGSPPESSSHISSGGTVSPASGTRQHSLIFLPRVLSSPEGHPESTASCIPWP